MPTKTFENCIICGAATETRFFNRPCCAGDCYADLVQKNDADRVAAGHPVGEPIETPTAPKPPIFGESSGTTEQLIASTEPPAGTLTVLKPDEGPPDATMKEAAPLAVYDPLRAQYAEKHAAAVALLKTEVTPDNCKALEPSFKRMRLDFVPVRTGVDKVRKGRNQDKQKEIDENNKAGFEIMRLCEEIEQQLFDKENFAAMEAARLGELRRIERTAELEALGAENLHAMGLAGMEEAQYQMMRAGYIAAKAKREGEARIAVRWELRQKQLSPLSGHMDDDDWSHDELREIGDAEFTNFLHVLAARKLEKEEEARKTALRVTRAAMIAGFPVDDIRTLFDPSVDLAEFDAAVFAVHVARLVAIGVEREDARKALRAEREEALKPYEALFVRSHDFDPANVTPENWDKFVSGLMERKRVKAEEDAAAEQDRKDALAAQEALKKQAETTEAKNALRRTRDAETRRFPNGLTTIQIGCDLAEITQDDFTSLLRSLEVAQDEFERQQGELVAEQNRLKQDSEDRKKSEQAAKDKIACDAAALAAAGDAEKLLHWLASIPAPPALANAALGAKINDAHREYRDRIDKAASSLRGKSKHAEPRNLL